MKRNFLQQTLWVVFFLCLLSLQAAGSPGIAFSDDNPQEERPAADEYLLAPGDALEIIVWKEPDLTRTSIVRSDGRISLPLVGEVIAAGITLPQLSATLKGKYVEYIADPSVSVILQKSMKRYYIIGQIVTPGEFPLEFPISLVQALARAGGFKEWAKLSEISVVRKEKDKTTVLHFDFAAVMKGQNLEQNIDLHPLDTIIVP